MSDDPTIKERGWDASTSEASSTDALTNEPASQERPVTLSVPGPDRVLYVILWLNRQVSPEMQDQEIVSAHVEALGSLFPQRIFVVRTLSQGSRGSLTHTTSPLARTDVPVALSHAAAERHGLSESIAQDSGVILQNAYEPLTEHGRHGFDVPLVDADRIIAVLSVEYSGLLQEPQDDRPLIVQLALQLGAALRNARLLRESIYLKDYLSKLIEHANAPIAVLNRKRRVRVVNRALLQLLDMGRSEVLDRDFVSLLSEDVKLEARSILQSVMEGTPISNLELQLKKRAGDYARLAINAAPISGADGKVDSVIAIGRDLTKVRDLEEQVIQAEKLATLGQLAAGVVHELNNPLTSISVYGDYLLGKLTDAGVDAGDLEKMGRIVENAQRILRFTRDLVTYARPSQESPQPLSLRRLLEQSIAFCEHVISESGASIQEQYAEDLPSVYGVRDQLHQVFINLITNACQAMPEGAGQLLIQASFEEPDYVTVKLTDNGAGITPDQIDKIFEPFFSTKGAGKGTGLGLSIVRNILQQHGGSIELESRVGEGTTFTVALPCKA